CFRLAWPVELRPGWFHGSHGNTTRFQCRFCCQCVRDPVEPHERKAPAFGGGAERADLLPAGHDPPARGRRGLFVSESHDAATAVGALLDARNDLLADIAAFVEIDAVKLVHTGLVWERVAIDEVETATRHAVRDAMGFIVIRTAQPRADIGGSS